MRTFRALVIATVIGFAHVANAGVFIGPDLTGTWSGKLDCKGLLASGLPGAGELKLVAKDATLEITQDEGNLAAALEAEDPDTGVLTADPMCGSRTWVVRGWWLSGPKSSSSSRSNFRAPKCSPSTGRVSAAR